MSKNQQEHQDDQVKDRKKNADEEPLSVGHLESGEKIPTGVVALRKGLTRRDKAIAERKNAFYSELISDSPSFVEVGHAAFVTAAEMTLGPVTHAVLPILSASAAGYMLWTLNDEQKKDKAELAELLDIWKRYRLAKDQDQRLKILSEAGLSLEAIPEDIDGFKDFDFNRFSLMAQINETSESLKQKPKWKIKVLLSDAAHLSRQVRDIVWNVLRAVPGNLMGVGRIVANTASSMHTFYKLHKQFNQAAAQRKKSVKSYFNDADAVKRIETAATGELDLSKVTVDKVEVLGQKHDIAPETIAQIKKIRKELNEEIKSVYKNGTCLFAQSFFILFNVAQAAFVNGPSGNPMVIANIAGASMALEPLKEFAKSLEEANKKINSKLAEEAENLAKLALIPDETETEESLEQENLSETDVTTQSSTNTPAETDEQPSISAGAKNKPDFRP